MLFFIYQTGCHFSLNILKIQSVVVAVISVVVIVELLDQYWHFLICSWIWELQLVNSCLMSAAFHWGQDEMFCPCLVLIKLDLIDFDKS